MPRFAMRLAPVEILNAVTNNAAYSVISLKTIGSFDTGKQAITIYSTKSRIISSISFRNST